MERPSPSFSASAKGLAGYAMPDEKTLGRRFPEEPHPYRSDYQRDRDRVVHTKAFRRLEKKTQVFAPHYSDHFRNRLTHTIEVSQIARTISKALLLNDDLSEVLALSHDIGHPPFGHEGEKVLNDIMRRYDSGFDHNLHALRIVEDFERKYADFWGLNLTFEVREGIVKHSRDYSEADQTYVDISDYRLGERPPLEAQLIDLADEIAYNSADLDDGYASGLITVEQLMSEVKLFSSLYKEVQAKYPDASEKLWFGEAVRRLIDLLVTSLVEQTSKSLRRNGIGSLEAVRCHPDRLVAFGSEAAELNAHLKRFLHGFLYEHSVLKEGRESVRQLLEEVFNHFWAQPAKLPGKHSHRIGELSVDRVVCDYIAGMTDAFARQTYQQISG
jgi:dGTPase